MSAAVLNDPPTTATEQRDDDQQKQKEEQTPPPAPRPPLKIRTIHLLIPYTIGLIWILLHPIVSVVTGELKCRGLYIDESALEPGNLRVLPYHTNLLPTLSSSADGGGTGMGMCDAINEATVTRSPFVTKRGRAPPQKPEKVPLSALDNIVCRSHSNATGDTDFDVVRILPASSPAEPAEAIVLVVDSPSSSGGDRRWDTADLHLNILALVGRLADPKSTPWLSKTVMIVSPNSQSAVGKDDLDATIHAFLGAYLGTSGEIADRPLPASFTSFMIRQVIVIDTDTQKSSDVAAKQSKPQLRILPQGRRGVLPNLDFVFALTKIFKSATMWKDARLRMYPHHEKLAQLEHWAGKHLPQKAKQYGADLLGMVGFARSLVVGPYPPHSPVLARGIDAVTIQAVFPYTASAGQYRSPLAAEFVQRLEQSIRALSNLHERLHHSVTQYLLPSPTKFVSNGEYTYPTVLVILPLAIRAASLALVDLERFSFAVALRAGVACLGVAAFIWTFAELGMVGDLSIMNTLLVLAYALTLLALTRISGGATSRMNDDDEDEFSRRDRRSIQFVACLLAVYVHVPMALAHVSLAIVSALFWTPVLAFPTYKGGKRGALQKMLAGAFLFVSWPPVWVVPNAFPEYTMYVTSVYVPLHLLLMSLWLF